MKAQFTIAALVGAVLATVANASPVPQNATSKSASTTSFGPDYVKTVGSFTAMAVVVSTSASVTPASSTHAFSGFPTNFGHGPVVPAHDFNPNTTLAVSVVATPTPAPTKTSRFEDPTVPKFRGWGHGPVVPGQGFNPHTLTGQHNSSIPGRHANAADKVVPTKPCRSGFRCWFNKGKPEKHEHDRLPPSLRPHYIPPILRTHDTTLHSRSSPS